MILSNSSDDAFLHCAVAANADAIVSGGRHLLDLSVFQNFPILAVAQFLKRV